MNLARDCIKRGFIKSKNKTIVVDREAIEAEKLDRITDNYRRDTYNVILNLVGKQLEHLLQKTISVDELAKLERYLHEHIFFDKYKACIYMNYHNLINLSYIISHGLIDTNFVHVKSDEIRVNDKIESYQIKKNHERMKQYYYTLTRAINSDVGKDLYLSIAASEGFEKSNFPKSLSDTEKNQIILLMKYILADHFPSLKITYESVDIARDFLVSLIKEMSISDLSTFQAHEQLIRETMQNNMHKYIEKKVDSKVEDHIKISLFGSKKTSSKLNKITAELVNKIQVAAKTELPIHEKLNMISLLKEVLKDKDYHSLKLIELSGQLFEDAIIATVLKKENRENVEKMRAELKKLIIEYNTETFTGDNYDFSSDTEKNLKRSIKNNQLSQDQLNTAFITAVRNNSIDLVKWILKESKEIDINYRKNEHTALGYAINNSTKEMVEFLLANGADPNMTTTFGFTPLMFALHNSRTDIARLIQTKVGLNKQEEIFFKIIKGQISYEIFTQEEMIEKFIEWKVNIEATDEYGNTPLIWAAWENQKDAVKILLENKADVNKLGAGSKSALKNAYQRGNIEIIEMLVKAGSRDSMDILFQAIKEGEKDIVQALLNLKILDPDAKDSLGNTPLSYANFLDEKDIVTILEKETKQSSTALVKVEELISMM